jgi:SPP1 family predicted phage head-tail adaptor
MAFDPGRMRHQATFNAKTRAPDGAGGYTVTPAAPVATLTDVWGELKPLGGTERLRAMQLTAEPTHTWRMWYDASVTRDMTMTVDGVTYEIVSVPVSPKNEGELLEFLVRQLKAVV